MASRNLPERISRLNELTSNLWWSWNHEGRELFRQLDRQSWLRTRHNAYMMLNEISDEVLLAKSNDEDFLKYYDDTIIEYDKYLMKDQKWYSKNYELNNHHIAYFSMEFGIHQSLPIYSGGLGVLAGDTIKEASDLGVPMVAIGFLYGRGYFTQRIPSHGWQEAISEPINMENVPLKVVKDNNGDLLKLKVTVGNDIIKVIAWQLKVGNVELYLLDTDINDNKPWYRTLSHRLYGGDQEMRINQEIVLAIAGEELLHELKYQPKVWHLNEGHCAFISIKRILREIEKGLDYTDAFEIVKKSTVFTTHTPVPAGHDAFPLDLVENKLNYLIDRLGIDKKQFFDLGVNIEGNDNRFNMTILGINTAHIVNSVSQLHLEVTKNMWKEILTKNYENTKIIGITNGIHSPTFIAGKMRKLYEKYISENWIDEIDNQMIWDNLDQIPNNEFWDSHMKNKIRLIEYIREYARRKRKNKQIGSEQILASGAFLDPKALTIGFARRFATYKRANLIFKDINRIRKIMNNEDMPVQIIFAGKAHPADDPGKHLIQSIYREALSEENLGRVAFVEDYDLHSAKYLVQGVDIWLNTPLRPYEASGTSGMKAAQNGVPHFSTLDGWWVECANHGINGWVISDGIEMENADEQSMLDSENLYDILENEIVPLYYNRDKKNIPNEWIKVTKKSIYDSISLFSSKRMLKEYVMKMYRPTID